MRNFFIMNINIAVIITVEESAGTEKEPKYSHAAAVTAKIIAVLIETIILLFMVIFLIYISQYFSTFFIS